MTSEEKEQYIVYSDLPQTSALSPPENSGSLASLQKFISDSMYLSVTPSAIGKDGNIPAKVVTQGGGVEPGCLMSKGVGADGNTRFHNLLHYDPICAQSIVPSVTFPGIFVSKNGMFQSPLESLPGCLETNNAVTEPGYGYAWNLEGQDHYCMMEGDVCEVVANVVSDSKDDQQKEQALCDVDEPRQTVAVNKCNLGNSLQPMASFAPVHFEVLLQGETCDFSAAPGKALPGPCSIQPSTYLSSPSIPLIHTASGFLQPTCLVPSASQGADLSYRFMPYCSQFHQAPFSPQQDSIGLVTQSQLEASFVRCSGTSWDSRSKKPCNCTKSQCLKLYCDCFANGDMCSNCSCINCYNNAEHESERYKAIKARLDRNPEAFQPKIANGRLGEIKGRHSKGCNCKRSGCLKNYCECYEAKITCSSTCKCVGCRNYNHRPGKNMGIDIDYTESVDTSISMTPTYQNFRCPRVCVTLDVIEATCGCLIAQAEDAEKEGHTLPQAEKMILQEFGQCLAQIVQSIFKCRGLHI